MNQRASDSIIWPEIGYNLAQNNRNLGERLTGSDTQASPAHALHVPLPALNCTSTLCTTCHPQ